LPRIVPFRRTLEVSRLENTQDPLSRYFSLMNIDNPLGVNPPYIKETEDPFVDVPNSVTLDWSWAGFSENGSRRNLSLETGYRDSWHSALAEADPNAPIVPGPAQLRWQYPRCGTGETEHFNFLWELAGLRNPLYGPLVDSFARSLENILPHVAPNALARKAQRHPEIRERGIEMTPEGQAFVTILQNSTLNLQTSLTNPGRPGQSNWPIKNQRGAILFPAPAMPGHTPILEALEREITIRDLIENFAQMTPYFQAPPVDLDGEIFVTAIQAVYDSINLLQMGAPQRNFYADLNMIEFDTYNFVTEVPWLADYFSSMAMLGYEAGQALNGNEIQATSVFGTINPEYNFYAPEYEHVVANSNIPEAVLPNLYIYSFATDQDLGAPGWQQSDNETLRGFDRLIKLSEFKETILPDFTCANAFEDGVLECIQDQTWINNYAENAKNVSIDVTSEFASSYYNTITPASQMDIYSRFNAHKGAFPMYIEMGFPTSPLGSLGRVIESADASVNFVNGLFSPSVQSVNERMCLTTQGLGSRFNNHRLRNWIEDGPIWMYYAFGSEPMEAELAWVEFAARNWVNSQPIQQSYPQDLKIIDYDQWFAGVREEVRAAILSGDEEQDQQRGCLSLVDRARLQAIQNMIEAAAITNAKTYPEYLQNKLCEQETIAYKLIKCATNEDGSKGDVIQNFYFPNTSREDIIRFVDTQVKYGKKYTFELYAYAVVYGTKFRFRVNQNQTNLELNEEHVPVGDNDAWVLEGLPIGMVMNIESIPSPKIIEYPIFTSLQAGLELYGLSYGPVSVKDRPPMPPSFQIHPYRGNYREVLINIQSGGGEVSPFVGSRAQPWYIIEPQELSQGPTSANEILRHQKQYENYSLVYPQMEFSDEGAAEVQRMEIWRIAEDDLPNSITNRRELYRLFAGNLHKVLDTSGDPEVPEEERALGLDFRDTLEPNRKYYYTVRAVDVHGNRSNPSLVWQVELLYRDGIYIPKIELFDVPLVPKTSTNKTFARFLEVKAADIQTQIYEPTFATGDNDRPPGQKGLTEEQVQANKFVVRVTSLDTARKFDIDMTFTSKDILPDS
jgi:hypothetical protein